MVFLDIALRNAARGFRVHPLIPKDKRPLLKDWPALATSDRVQIETWAAQYPEANAGAAADDQFCMLESDDLPALVSKLTDASVLDFVYTVQARPNRPHFYFRQTDATRALGNCDLPGVFEFKQHNRYVVAEGSISPYGPRYELVCDGPIIPMPDSLAADLKRLYGERRRNDAQTAGEPIGYGGRHDFLTSVAGKLRNSGLDADAIHAALIPINEARCAPPLPEADIEHIAQSVARYELPKPAPEVTVGEPTAPEAPRDWRTLFHTKEETINAPPLTFLIDNFLQTEGVTAIAAPVRERKTLISLNMAKALLTGEPLFGHFKVTQKPERVLYLVPEMALGPFSDRLKRLGLLDYVGNTLFYRTMTAEGRLRLTDANLAPALPGSVVFLDTAVRFMDGDEKDSSDVRIFAEQVFSLLRAGALAVVLLHHSLKAASKADTFELEDALRGSGDIGAFLSACWGTRLQDPAHPYQSRSYIDNLKQRDFECTPFEVTCNEDGVLTYCNDVATPTLASRTQYKGNRDGKDEQAAAIVAAHPDLSVRALAAVLKDNGVPRSPAWVTRTRAKPKYDAQQETPTKGPVSRE